MSASPINIEEKDGLKSVLKAVMKSSKGLGEWSVGDVTVGLNYLIKAKQREKEENIDKVDLSEAVLSSAIVHPLKVPHYVKLISASYSKDIPELLKRAPGFNKGDIVKHEVKSTTTRPAYYIAVDRYCENVVLGIRGTATLSDIMTDLCADTCEFLSVDCYAHRGMAKAALYFDTKIMPEVEAVLNKHRGYNLRIVGHSLGAGTACLLTMLVLPRLPNTRCVALAPPACISPNLADKFDNVMISFVLEDDLVPRFQPYSAEVVRIELVEYPWGKEAREDITNTKLVKLTASGLSSVDEALKLSALTSAGMRKTQGTLYCRRSDILAMTSAFQKKSDPLEDEDTLQMDDKRMAEARAKEGKDKKKKSGGFMSTFRWNKKRADEAMEEEETKVEEEKKAEEEEKKKEAEAAKEEIKVLQPPGRVIHIVKGPTGDHFFIEKPNAAFETLSLSSSMISDHSMNSYIPAIENAHYQLV